MEKQRLGERQWEECGRAERPNRWSRLHVTMNPHGDISLTRTALDVLGTSEAVHLLYDRINQTIGLQPTRRAISNAYPLGKRGDRGGAVIRGFRLCQEFGIRLAETIQFVDPHLDEDGILILDLRKVTRSTSGKRKRS